MTRWSCDVIIGLPVRHCDRGTEPRMSVAKRAGPDSRSISLSICPDQVLATDYHVGPMMRQNPLFTGSDLQFLKRLKGKGPAMGEMEGWVNRWMDG